MDSPYCGPLQGYSIFQPVGCCVLLQNAQPGCESLLVSPLPPVSLTGSRHTPASGGAASPAGKLHHGSETSPGNGWQSDSHSASGRTCSNKLALWRLSHNYHINPLAPEFPFKFFKMWIIQEPKKVALRNKRHFEEKKTEITQHV